MTSVDLQRLFEDKLKVIYTETQKPFLTSEIEQFLNQALDEYIEKLADAYEITERARKALAPLVRSTSFSPVASIAGITAYSDDSVFLDFSALTAGHKIRRVFTEQAETSTGDFITIKPVTQDQYMANINNPFKNPYSDLVWRLDLDFAHELIPSSSITISAVVMRYLVDHVAVNIASDATLELEDVDLKRIVDIATQLAARSLGADSTKGPE